MLATAEVRRMTMTGIATALATSHEDRTALWSRKWSADLASGFVGSSGIRRRKQTRHLPKVRGHVDSGPEPSPWTPMGVVAAYGKIARAAGSSDHRQRRAGMAMALAFMLPLAVIAIIAI